MNTLNPMMVQDLPKRCDIPIEQQWDATSVYPSHEAWEEACERVSAQLPEVEGFKGRLGQGPTSLLEWFDTVERVFRELYRVHVYAGLFHNADTTDQDAAARDARARMLFSRALTAASFAEPELLEIDDALLARWMSAEPRLKQYEHYFHNLNRRRPHVRSPEVEELLGLVSEPFDSASKIHGTLADADLRFRPATSSAPDCEPLTVAQGTIGALLTHPDREVRRTAWQSYADSHLEHQSSMAACLATCVTQHVVLARARKHRSCLEAALAENAIPVAVFHGFIDAFRRHLPIWHRYFALRRRCLGSDELHVFDLKAPLTTDQPKIPFRQAVDWIADGVAPLGREYVDTLRRGVEVERWVDARPNQGKRSGAFSMGAPGTHPFILMSDSEDVYSLSTLAHELGHSMHSHLTWKHQPFVYCDYSIFVAEVASNFHQALVRSHLLSRTKDRDLRVALIEEAISNFHRYFFLMPTLARFELEIHERAERGEALTAGAMNALMRDLFAEGYGGEVVMDNERVGITWAQFSTHLYSNFYVFQYGTGIAAAHALVDRIVRREPGAAASVLELLGSGSSVYPIENLRRAGVDLTQPEPVEKAFAALDGLIDRLEELFDHRNDP